MSCLGSGPSVSAPDGSLHTPDGRTAHKATLREAPTAPLNEAANTAQAAPAAEACDRPTARQPNAPFFPHGEPSHPSKVRQSNFLTVWQCSARQGLSSMWQ